MGISQKEYASFQKLVQSLHIQTDIEFAMQLIEDANECGVPVAVQLSKRLLSEGETLKSIITGIGEKIEKHQTLWFHSRRVLDLSDEIDCLECTKRSFDRTLKHYIDTLTIFMPPPPHT